VANVPPAFVIVMKSNSMLCPALVPAMQRLLRYRRPLACGEGGGSRRTWRWDAWLKRSTATACCYIFYSISTPLLSISFYSVEKKAASGRMWRAMSVWWLEWAANGRRPSLTMTAVPSGNIMVANLFDAFKLRCAAGGVGRGGPLATLRHW